MTVEIRADLADGLLRHPDPARPVLIVQGQDDGGELATLLESFVNVVNDHSGSVLLTLAQYSPLNLG